ncbi:MAG: hypothetical protein AABZ67_01975 [Pseudomonadota bacterium]
MMDGTTQLLSFNVYPREARCTLTRVDDGELGTVGGSSSSITVSKDKDDIVVSCAAPGYLSKTSRIVSSASGGGVASVFLFDLGITDLATGAYWKYPAMHSVSLERDPDLTRQAAPIPAVAPSAAAYVERGPGSDMNRKVEPELPPPPPTGKFTAEAERLAKNEQCHTSPAAALTATGPGFENYSIPCASGDAMSVRCEFGNCRALK